jgi:hypothetical protein
VTVLVTKCDLGIHWTMMHQDCCPQTFTGATCAAAAAAAAAGGCAFRGLAIDDFPLLLLSVGEYVAVRRGLQGLSKADALAGKRAEVRDESAVNQG